MINTSSHPLSLLLPYQPQGKKFKDFSRCLNHYTFLLKASLGAIQALKAGYYKEFDPLVTENFCQSRGLMLALKVEETRDSILNREEFILDALEKITLRQRNIVNFKHENLNFYQLIEDVELRLNENEIFFIMSYILTMAKNTQLNKETKRLEEKTCVKNLSKILEGNANFFRDITAELRLKVATISVEFVKKLAVSADCEVGKIVNNENNRLLYKNLPCLPYFSSTVLILQKALKEKLPIVLRVHQVAIETNNIIRSLYYYYKSNGTSYKQSLLDGILFFK